MRRSSVLEDRSVEMMSTQKANELKREEDLVDKAERKQVKELARPRRVGGQLPA
jgi:hypothetical protein